MNRTVFVVLSTVLLAGFSTPSWAQRVDVAGGYSFLRDVTSQCNSDCNVPGGWFGTLGVNVAPKVDVVADFSDTFLALASGGGLDVKLNDQWGIRGGVNLRFVKPKTSGDWDKIRDTGSKDDCNAQTNLPLCVSTCCNCVRQ